MKRDYMENKKEKNKVYFGKEAEQAVKDYVCSDDYYFRQQLYLEKILPVFDKLVENIIFKYDFLNLGDNYEDLKSDVLAHLYMNIDKYNPFLGFKSYSYFGTAAKRYLQQRSINKAFENKNIDDIYDRENGQINDNMLESAINIEDENKRQEDREFIKILIELFEKKKTKDEKEAKVIEAITYLLKHYEDINVSNKKHLYILIRDYTGLDTKTITKIMLGIMKDYNKAKHKYVECEL